MAIQFNKHAEEANLFIKELAKTLGQPNEFGRTGILLQSVMHTLRDCISVKASIDLIDELPMFLKGLYVDNWKYGEFSGKIRTLEEFKNKVKEKQDRYGEMEFDWPMHTDELIRKVLEHLSQYISEGEAKELISQFSSDMKMLLEEGLLSHD